MAHITEDEVLESTTTATAGDLTLAGALTGFRSFGSVMAIGDTCKYALFAVDANGNRTGAWERGLATYSGTNTLARTLVTGSSTGSILTLAAGTKYVCIALLSEDVIGEGYLRANAAGFVST